MSTVVAYSRITAKGRPCSLKGYMNGRVLATIRCHPIFKIIHLYNSWSQNSCKSNTYPLKNQLRLLNLTLEFVGVIVTPVVHFSSTSLCSAFERDSRSDGTRISYCRTRRARMHTLSVIAKREPMQPRAPAENVRTVQ